MRYDEIRDPSRIQTPFAALTAAVNVSGGEAWGKSHALDAIVVQTPHTATRKYPFNAFNCLFRPNCCFTGFGQLTLAKPDRLLIRA